MLIALVIASGGSITVGTIMGMKAISKSINERNK